MSGEASANVGHKAGGSLMTDKHELDRPSAHSFHIRYPGPTGHAEDILYAAFGEQFD
jgi:hypothetical protein